MRSQIESVVKKQGDLVDATNKLKRMINPNQPHDIRLNQIAEKYDSGRKGILSVREFNAFLEALKEAGLTDEQKTLVTNLADKNYDGQVQYDEFIAFLKADIQVDAFEKAGK